MIGAGDILATPRLAMSLGRVPARAIAVAPLPLARSAIKTPTWPLRPKIFLQCNTYSRRVADAQTWATTVEIEQL